MNGVSIHIRQWVAVKPGLRLGVVWVVEDGEAQRYLSSRYPRAWRNE